MSSSGTPATQEGRILVVDDNPDIRSVQRIALEESGFEVWTASSGEEALELLEKKGLPHLALVDIMMPGMSGLDLCQKVQEFIDLPIIMVTAVDEPQTVVEAIDKYAEDYITKPINDKELVARVRRLLRRIGDFSYTLEPRVRVDDRLEVEFARQQAILDGDPVPLTPTETKLLYILMRNAGRTVRTDFMLRRLWPLEEVFEDSLRSHIYRLRQKIEVSPKRPKYVITQRGLGYRFPTVKAGATAR